MAKTSQSYEKQQFVGEFGVVEGLFVFCFVLVAVVCGGSWGPDLFIN